MEFILCIMMTRIMSKYYPKNGEYNNLAKKYHGEFAILNNI